MTTEATQRIREALKKIQPDVTVYKQDAEIEGSVIKFKTQSRTIEITISNSSIEDTNIGQFF